MSILNLLRKPTTSTDPHADALAAWNSEYAAVGDKVATAQTALASCVAREQRGSVAAMAVKALDDSIIEARAAVELGTGIRQRVEELEAARERARVAAEPAAADAKVAALVKAKHEATLRDLVARQAQLRDEWPALALPVLRQKLAASADDFKKARSAFLAAAVKSFGIALACDNVAAQGNLGEFSDSGLARELFAALGTVPAHASFNGPSLDALKAVADAAERAFRDLAE